MEVRGIKRNNQKTFIIKRGVETKNAFFGLQTSRLREEEEKGRRRRERRREEGEDQAKVWMLAFAMNFIWTLGILA